MRGATLLVLAVGLLLVGAGGLWTAQSLGYLPAGGMTGGPLFGVVGPAVAGVGVALLVVAVQSARRR